MCSKIFKIVLTFCMLLAVSLPAYSVPTVTASLDSAKLLMGNTTGLTITVDMPSRSAKVKFPLMDVDKSRRFVGLLNDTIEISTKYSIDTINESGRNMLRYNMSIQAFDSGRYNLPRFEFEIDNQPVQSNSLTLDVIPVKAKADDKLDDFSDVVAPFEIGYADNEEQSLADNILDLWWLWLLLLVFLALMAYGIIRYRKTGHVFPAPKVLTPYESAIKRLEDLKKRKLWQNGKEKEYYSRLVDILRLYLRDQFGINAMEMTTRQIMKAVRKNAVIKPFADSLKPVLDISDFVKFAKVKPLPEDNEDVYNRVAGFVDSSKRAVDAIEAEKEKGGEA